MQKGREPHSFTYMGIQDKVLFEFLIEKALVFNEECIITFSKVTEGYP